MQRLTISLDDTIAQAIDDFMEARGYSNRSEAIRDLVRDSLIRSQEAPQTKHCVAAVSYVYDYDGRDLALRLDYQLHHILVDEFQDTSWTQFNLLEKLTAGWQAGDGRTLFIVGDGMQSCYGFRNADVSLFLRARDSGIGPVTLQPLQMSVNFRSDAAVVGWVNEVFAEAFPLHDDVLRGGVCYSASEASKATEPAAGVCCQLFVAAANQQDDSDDDESDSDE